MKLTKEDKRRELGRMVVNDLADLLAMAGGRLPLRLRLRLARKRKDWKLPRAQ